MDLDKPLDDMIASNRKPRGGNGDGAGGGRPRPSRERSGPTPYAVSLGSSLSLSATPDHAIRLTRNARSTVSLRSLRSQNKPDPSVPLPGRPRTNGYTMRTLVLAPVEDRQARVKIEVTRV